MKKVLIGSLLVVGLAAGVAFAHDNGYYHGRGSHMMGAGPHMMGGNTQMMKGAGWGYGNCQGPGFSGSRGNAFSNQEFLDVTASLRKQLHEKRFEYNEAVRGAMARPMQLAEIEKDIIDLRAQIHEQALKYRNTVE